MGPIAEDGIGCPSLGFGSRVRRWLTKPTGHDSANCHAKIGREVERGQDLLGDRGKTGTPGRDRTGVPGCY